MSDSHIALNNALLIANASTPPRKRRRTLDKVVLVANWIAISDPDTLTREQYLRLRANEANQ